MKKKKFFRKILILFSALVMIVGGASIYQAKHPSTVRAFGELMVDFHTVTAGDPIFVVNNMMPGNSESRVVDVTNGGTLARFVTVKGIKKSETGDLSTVLSIVIREGAIDRYGGTSGTGSKHLSDFFADSANPNGVRLSILGSGAHTTYTFIVTFNTSAGNHFQAKQVVFDLTFSVITAQNLVINEVYYQVDSAHGMESSKDRGILCGGCQAQNIGNSPGSKNLATCVNANLTTILQGNITNIQNNVSASANIGGNQALGNNGGNTNINTGKASASVSISNKANKNVVSINCGGSQGQNDEWVEIYNPTDKDINLKGWTLTDNSGQATKINSNKTIKAGSFAILSKSASTWKFWNVDPNALKVELGREIGDGLDNSGDRLILKNPKGTTVDALSYGNDTSVLNPSIPSVALGSSIERIVAGFDTDLASNWKEQPIPTPGN